MHTCIYAAYMQMYMYLHLCGTQSSPMGQTNQPNQMIIDLIIVHVLQLHIITWTSEGIMSSWGVV